MPTEWTARGNGETNAQPTGTESELQLPGRCSGTGGAHETAKAYSDRKSTETHETIDPSCGKDARVGDGRFQVSVE